MASLIVVCIVACVAAAQAKSLEGPACSLPIKKLPKFEPLIVIGQKLALPEKYGHVTLGARDDVILACPGRNNALEHFKGSDVTGQCAGAGKETLQVAGTNHAVDSMGCVKSVTGGLRVKSGKCSGRGTAMELGFSVRAAWYPMIEVCHDTAASATFYSTHALYGASLTSSEHRGNRPGFQEGGVYETFNADVAYKQVTQSATLAAILQSRQLADSYLQRTFLARGHLAPNADFVLDAYQDLSFFYVNAAPQWQSVNAGNWVSLENTVRRHAMSHGAALTVITGTHGVLQLPDNTGVLRDIYLVNNATSRRLPVPEFFWKVVYDPKAQTGIGFVSVNKFFGRSEPLCPSVCERYKWRPTKGSWDNVEQGHVYCCEVTALRSAISHVPRLTVKKALVYEG